MRWKPLWKYIQHRESIRLARVGGEQWPWTDDPILRRFKFTNVKRVHDKTTQAFLRLYEANAAAKPEIALYNCGVRRFTGTVEVSDYLGWLSGHSPATLRRAVRKVERAWTGAYLIRASRTKGEPKIEEVIRYLKDLWVNARAVTEMIAGTNSWECGYALLKDVYGFGPFMAKEVLQDYILWLHLRQDPLDDEETFTPIGPGARRGLNRLANRPLTYYRADQMLDEVRELLGRIQPLWTKVFRFNERLTAHDIQFCLCELDKYERVRLGQGRPRSLYHAPEEA